MNLQNQVRGAVMQQQLMKQGGWHKKPQRTAVRQHRFGKPTGHGLSDLKRAFHGSHGGAFRQHDSMRGHVVRIGHFR